MDNELVKFTEKDFVNRAQEILLIAKNQQVAIVDANDRVVTVIGVGKTHFLPELILDFDFDDALSEGVIYDDHNPWLD